MSESAADRPATVAEMDALRTDLAEVKILLRALLNRRSKRLDPTPAGPRSGVLTDEQLEHARRAITNPKRRSKRA